MLNKYPFWYTKQVFLWYTKQVFLFVCYASVPFGMLYTCPFSHDKMITVWPGGLTVTYTLRNYDKHGQSS